MSPYYTHYDIPPEIATGALHLMEHWMSLSVEMGTVYVGSDENGDTWTFVRAGLRDNVLIAPKPWGRQGSKKRRRATWAHEIESATPLICDARSHVRLETELFEVDHGIDHDDQPFLCVSDHSRTFLFRRPGVSSAWSQRWSKRVSEGPSFKVDVESSDKREGVTALARALSVVALKGKA